MRGVIKKARQSNFRNHAVIFASHTAAARPYVHSEGTTSHVPMDVVVNAKFKDSMYYQWAMWMMNEPRKVQPKSGNFIAADFTTTLSWCTYAWKEVRKETILSGVKKCYMTSVPGPEFDVEAAPEKLKV